MRVRLRLGAIAATVAVAAALAPAASATPAPGTPLVPAPGVPGHGRAWELVTPPDTVSARTGETRAISAAGDRLVFTTVGVLPGATEGTLVADNLAVRGPNGWATTPLSSPGDALFGSGLVSDPSLSTQVWANGLELPGGEEGVGLFRGPPTAYELLLDIGKGGDLAGASTDLRTLVFSSERHLLPADAGRTEGKSVYALSDSGLRLVDVDDLGLPLSPCGSVVPGGFRSSPPGPFGTVSSDGGRIFFVSPPPESSCPGPPRAYLREGEATTEISASRCTRPDCNEPREIYFAGATPDGSSAFIVTEQQLTNDDEDSLRDLYRYDLPGGELTRISTPRPPGFPPVGAEAAPVRLASDGSRVYFEFFGRLIPELGDDEGVNVYLADQQGLRFVTADRGFGISEDGRYFVYTTSGNDGDGHLDVYRYDAATGDTELISAGPVGGDGPFGAEVEALSADGRRIFFSTSERLLAADSNAVDDVYESFDGDLALVSAGAGDAPAHVDRIAPDGRTAIVKTGATLLPGDRDGGDVDLYAARIGGGFAEPPETAGDCAEAACRPAPPRVERPAPRAGAKGRIGLARLGPAAIRRIAASGRIAVLAEVPSAGRLRAVARARVDGRLLTVAAAERRVDAAGPVRLLLPLSAALRRGLARGDSFRVRLELRLSGLRPGRAVGFRLGGGGGR